MSKCQRCGCEITSKNINKKHCETCNIIVKKEQSKNRKEENTKRNKERDYSLDVGGKKCPCCGEYKEYKEFNKCYNEYDGYKSRCRDCQNTLTPEQKIRRKEYDDNRQHTPKRKEQIKKREEKIKADPIRKENKRIYQQQYKQEHKEERRIYTKEFIEHNPIEKIKRNVRANTRKAFKLYSKNGKTKSRNLYGIDYNKLFEKLGPQPDKSYQIDHIIPQIVFNFDLPGHVFLSQHPENLRWLEGCENSSKQDKIIWSLIEGNIFLEAICLELGITKEDDGKDGREIRERLYPEI